MMKLSIIIPVYNSSKILEKLISEINSNLSKKLKNLNNFDNDSVRTIAGLSLKKFHKIWFVKGIDLNDNVGQHGAIFIGLKQQLEIK